jgi:ribonuclease VapC
MSRAVLDASALLALLLDEPGGDAVAAALGDAVMSVVNVAEVVGHYARLGASAADVQALLGPLPIDLVPADRALSFEAGLLLAITRPLGLSLGDRYCLALARRDGAVALTAERCWREVAAPAGVRVELIR